MPASNLAPFDLNTVYRDGNPYPWYEQYRSLDPVHVIPADPEAGRWHTSVMLFRHEDCWQLLRDNRFGREFDGQQMRDPQLDSFQAVASHFMLFRDPPVHTRLRGTANLAFTPRQVEKMRPEIERMAKELLDEAAARGNEFDLISEYAFPLPMLVIASMLGIPREDYRNFRDAAADVAAALDSPVEGLQEFVARVDASTAFLIDYVRDLVADRKAHPRDDLLQQLIQAESEHGKLAEHELVATCILLIVAGHETTVNLIGNGTLALMQHPDQWQALVAQPALAKGAAEEASRYDAPVQATGRLAKQDVEIFGVQVPAGNYVSTILGSANRDERIYPNADTFDITREPGRTMSFGMGIHFCLGAPLARLEGEIALGTLARELPALSLVNDVPQWRPGAVFHGLKTLPVSMR